MDQPRTANLFPILKNATILQIMEEVNVPLTEMELTEPGRCKERVREVFVQLLTLCWGLTPQTLTTLPTRITTKQQTLSHPSIYNDALPEAKFFCLLSKLLRTCGYYEFGFKDLAAPQAKRLRRQLSALINFLKYREDMGHLEAQALEEREELFAALDEVTENHMTLKDHLEEARAMNHEKMIEREEAEAECKEMEAELAQQNKIQSSIRQETLGLKKSANELKDQIANLSIALRELQGEERQLSKEVVHSPDAIKHELAEATKQLERVKNTIVQKQSERRVVHKRVESTSCAEESIKDAVVAMDTMEIKVQEYEAVVEDCDDVQNRLEIMENDLEERKEDIAVQEQKLGQIEKQSSDTVAALTGSLSSAQNELDTAVNRLGVVESERLDGIACIEASEKRVEVIKARMDSEIKKAEQEVSKRIESFHKFEKQYWGKEENLNPQLGYLG